MATKLYVGNLSYTTTDQSLNNIFAEIGGVTSAQVVTDRFTGQSRGFGFVEMADEQLAQLAIASINGRNIDGRNVVVNESRPRENSGYRGGGTRGDYPPSRASQNDNYGNRAGYDGSDRNGYGSSRPNNRPSFNSRNNSGNRGSYGPSRGDDYNDNGNNRW